MGGSYSKYSGRRAGDAAGRVGIALNTDGELVDSSGRRILTDGYTNGSAEQPRGPQELARRGPANQHS